MKTHAFLINSVQFGLNRESISQPNIESVIDYILIPYKRIGLFSYNTYENVPANVFGISDVRNLILQIERWSNIRKSIINNMIKDLPNININNLSNYDEDTQLINYLKLCSGEYLYETQFYNSESQNSILTKSTIHNVKKKPYNYFVAYTNLFR